LLNRAEWWVKGSAAAAAVKIPAAGETESPRARGSAAKEESAAPLPDETLDETREAPDEAAAAAPVGSSASAFVDEPRPVIPLAADSGLEARGDELVLWREDRKYRVRGLE
jgi:hypothetical protein